MKNGKEIKTARNELLTKSLNKFGSAYNFFIF